jgi:hypothetical protein
VAGLGLCGTAFSTCATAPIEKRRQAIKRIFFIYLPNTISSGNSFLSVSLLNGKFFVSASPISFYNFLNACSIIFPVKIG